MEVVIWSKDNCGYCEAAKSLLTQKNISYTENKVGDTHTREQLLKAVPDAKSVPQIFIDGQLVGGFRELEIYFNVRHEDQ